VKNDELEHLDVFLMRADGSGVRAITHAAAYSGDSGGIAWSPDGRRLVVARFDAVGARTALFVMNADGSHSRRLTDWKLGAAGIPDWSARGDLIVFRVAPEETGIGNFFAIKADGTGLRQVTRFTGWAVGHKIAFSTDGVWVTFAAHKEGTNDIYVCRIDGSGLHRVARTPLEENGPAWGPATP
jgi:Tol biopolymer transport system component